VPAAPRRGLRLAVFTFDNLTGDDGYDWLAVGFAEALTNKLTGLDRVHVHERRLLGDLVRVHALDPAAVAAEEPAALRALTGCDVLVFGAVQAAGPLDRKGAPLRATARVVNTQTGRVGRGAEVSGTVGELLHLQSRLALVLAAQLRPELSEAEKRALRQQGTSDLHAYRACCEGIAALDRQDYAAAIEQLRDAERLHPGILYAEAHHALGTAFLRSGRTAEMLREFRGDVAARAGIWFDLGRAALQSGEYAKAAEAFGTFVRYTDNRFRRWHAPPLAGALFCPPPGAGTMLPAFLLDGRVYGVDAASGRLVWERRLPGARPLTATAEHLAVAQEDRLHWLELASGEEVWRQPLRREAARIAVAAPAGERLLLQAGAGSVTARARTDGQVLWRRAVSASAPALAADGAAVLVGGDGGELKALALGDGEPLWTVRLEAAVRRLALRDGRVYALLAGGNLVLLDRQTGRELWRLEDLASGDETMQPTALGVVVVQVTPSLCGYGRDGRVRWEVPLTATPERLLASDEVVVLFFAGGRRLAVYDALEGKPLAGRTLASTVTDAVLAGRILYGTHRRAGFACSLAPATAPDDRQGILLLARALEEEGRTAEAAAMYRHVLQAIDPACTAAREGLAALRRPATESAPR
jgi:tetratricopeptide (TPR) repeat protein